MIQQPKVSTRSIPYPSSSDIPVIALINPLTHDRAMELYYEVYDCIWTPIISDELIYRVNNALRKTVQTEPLDKSCSSEESRLALIIDNLEKNPRVTPLVLKTCQYLHQHIEQKLALDQVALAMGTNRSKLAAEFKQSLGKGAFEWLREQRLYKAKYLLCNSTMNIQEISLAVGYENSANFSTAYKKQFSLSPKHQSKLKQKNITSVI